MGLFDWNKGAGTPPCPAGSQFVAGQAKTNVCRQKNFSRCNFGN